MKILFCNYEYPPLGGGGGVVMAALARELARRHEVTVLTSRAFDLPAVSDDAGVQIVRTPVFFRRQMSVANLPSLLAYVPMAIARGLSLCRRGRFDLVNTHFVVPSGPAGQVLARLEDVPHVLSLHGGDLYDPSKRISPHRHAWLRGPIRRMLSAADALIGQSRNTVQHVRDIYHVNRNVELIPLGIDRPPVLRAPRAEFGLPEDAFVMTTVGRLIPRKATVQLVQALTRSGIPKAHLVIVGDGPDARAIMQAAAHAQLADRVHLFGALNDLEKFRALSVSDLFVSTSQHEGFGLVFLEAMAMGLPIVCYDHGGQTDFLSSEDSGYVIHLNDLDTFVGAITRLYRDADKRVAMGDRNRKRADQFFIDSCASRYEDVFIEAQERHCRRPSAEHRGTAV